MTTTRRTALCLGAACGATALGSCSGETSGAAGGPVTIPTAEVPEGGGIVSGDVVVTQPTAGEFKAFGSSCPHQGCAVTRVTTVAIVCPCHGSEFALEDGGVIRGPATEGLTARKVTVSGDRITVS